ncbi:hypothetical protein MMC18_003532 [Xylographa bjoerkii]|nr:hypothetical protein [Xylographa bjoerkii]
MYLNKANDFDARRSSNSTVSTDPATTKSLKPDTGVPVWVDIVIGVSSGIVVLGCLAIFLYRRYQKPHDTWIMSDKQAGILRREAEKPKQYHCFVAGARGAGFGVYAFKMTSFM